MDSFVKNDNFKLQKKKKQYFIKGKIFSINENHLIVKFKNEYGIFWNDEEDSEFSVWPHKYNLIDDYLFIKIKKIFQTKQLTNNLVVNDYWILDRFRHKNEDYWKKAARESPFNFYNLLINTRHKANPQYKNEIEEPAIIEWEEIASVLEEEQNKLINEVPKIQ